MGEEMKRSEVNSLLRDAQAAFRRAGWALPPEPRWDVTDLGLGDWRTCGLVLLNLAEEPEYCEKLMYAKRGMTTPAHTHRIKVEDIICRAGQLKITIWHGPPPGEGRAEIKLNGRFCNVPSGSEFVLQPGERIKVAPGIWHAFEPASDEVVIGEVSTANDDVNDNVFADPRIGRFPSIEEDEPAIAPLIGGGL